MAVEGGVLPVDVISFTDVSKIYRVFASPRDRLLAALFGGLGGGRGSEVHALRGVTGRVPRGRVVGLVGENGSGKSTLLKILSGTTSATSGDVKVTGRVASILELGSAFHPEVTGRKNVVLQAALLGLSRSETDAALPEIERFAELGDFFDRPVKTYSSGMAMRLAFAAATAVLPDVVLLDEALAVGDGRFQKKCVDRIHDLKASGRTILFCSHAMYYVSTLCDEAIWLREGEVAASGESQRVVLEYERFLAGKEQREQTALPSHAVPADSHGRIVAVEIVGAGAEPRTTFAPGEPWGVALDLAVDRPDRPVQVHLAVSTRDNVVCLSFDSRLDGVGPFVGQERYRLRIGLDSLPLAKGEFVVFAYLADEKSLALYDARSDRAFHVESDSWRSGLFVTTPRWERLA